MASALEAARNFIFTDARLLERHLSAALLDGASSEAALTALGAYRTQDGGWGHALEPDLRGPDAQVSAAMSALDVFARLGLDEHPWINETCEWLAGVTLLDGSVPQVLPSAAHYPAAPWMRPNTNGMLTFAIAAHLLSLGADHPWLERASVWCWDQIEHRDLAGYQIVFALTFLDAVPDVERAAHAVTKFTAGLDRYGNVPIPGGVTGEHVTPLTLSPRPGSPSRVLFTDQMIEDELDALESEQLSDGGWDFQFLHWAPGQEVEWRGIVTLAALETLRAHRRLE